MCKGGTEAQRRPVDAVKEGGADGGGCPGLR